MNILIVSRNFGRDGKMFTEKLLALSVRNQESAFAEISSKEQQSENLLFIITNIALSASL